MPGDAQPPDRLDTHPARRLAGYSVCGRMWPLVYVVVGLFQFKRNHRWQWQPCFRWPPIVVLSFWLPRVVVPLLLLFVQQQREKFKLSNFLTFIIQFWASTVFCTFHWLDENSSSFIEFTVIEVGTIDKYIVATTPREITWFVYLHLNKLSSFFPRKLDIRSF